eukprot:TRINITY_DN5382_c0_g1_i1.p1 TRINITY_DN5382_c0_g1~~TRINITY_DN5382_c0_g1_i1.p1  ORF type:complete len:480 (+),score=139.29 TRINITY_DN5382_c0_g1_i1:4-1443(+)
MLSAVRSISQVGRLASTRGFATASAFTHRFLPHNQETRSDMLETIGAESVEELFKDIPEDVRFRGDIGLPNAKSEAEVCRAMMDLSAKNMPASSAPFFCGAGYYRHHVPAAVDHLIQRSEFLTAYTPYQPEVSQGTLQGIYEFQTQVALLSGMDVANASMYDGATATAEAVLMARRLNKKPKVVVAPTLHPHYFLTLETATSQHTANFDIVTSAPEVCHDPNSLAEKVDKDTSCVVVQNPDIFGRVHDLRPLAAKCKENKTQLIVAVNEVVSLGMVASPGAMGADIFVGEGQSLGAGLNFGGPSCGLMATSQKNMRQLPGRLVGETVDADDERCFVLTMSTREQHIRREKATSNICTSAGIMGLAFSMHLTMLGEAGFRKLALTNHHRAHTLFNAIDKEVPAVSIMNNNFFNEITLRLPEGIKATELVEHLSKDDVLAGVPGGRLWEEPEMDQFLLCAATETTTDEDISSLCSALKKAL